MAYRKTRLADLWANTYYSNIRLVVSYARGVILYTSELLNTKISIFDNRA